MSDKNTLDGRILDHEVRYSANQRYIEIVREVVHQVETINILSGLLTDADRGYIRGFVVAARATEALPALRDAVIELEERMEPLVKKLSYHNNPKAALVLEGLRESDRRSLVTFYNDITLHDGYKVVAYIMQTHLEAINDGKIPELLVSEAGRAVFGGSKNAGRIPMLNHLAWMEYAGLIEVVRGYDALVAAVAADLASEKSATAALANGHGVPTLSQAQAEPAIIAEEVDESEDGDAVVGKGRNRKALYVRVTRSGLDWFITNSRWARRYAAGFEEAKHRHLSAIIALEQQRNAALTGRPAPDPNSGAGRRLTGLGFGGVLLAGLLALAPQAARADGSAWQNLVSVPGHEITLSATDLSETIGFEGGSVAMAAEFVAIAAVGLRPRLEGGTVALRDAGSADLVYANGPARLIGKGDPLILASFEGQDPAWSVAEIQYQTTGPARLIGGGEPLMMAGDWTGGDREAAGAADSWQDYFNRPAGTAAAPADSWGQYLTAQTAAAGPAELVGGGKHLMLASAQGGLR